MQVSFAARAQRQLADLHDYIAARSGVARADSYIGRIARFCSDLCTFPKRGAARGDLYPGLRVIGFERRVTVAFTVADDAVVIQGVFYGGQDFEAALLV